MHQSPSSPPFPTSTSIPYSTIPQQSSRTKLSDTITHLKGVQNLSCLTQTNFQFQIQRQRGDKDKNGQRIHCKQSIKKLQSKNLGFARKQKKTNKKENSFGLKKQIQQFQSNQERVMQNIALENHSQFLEIKSLEPNKQTIPLQKTANISNTKKHQRHSSGMLQCSSQSQLSGNEDKIKINPIETVPERSVDDLFQEVHRKLQCQLEMEKIIKNQNCFYSKLKIKLQKETRHIQDQRIRNQNIFVIQGCQLRKHTRNISLTSRSAFTDRSRPKSQASPRRSITARKRSRPSSCVQESADLFESNLKQKAGTDSTINQYRKSQKAERKTTNDRIFGQNKYIKSINTTFHNSQILQKNKTNNIYKPFFKERAQSRNKKSSQKQIVNIRVGNLLKQCDKQTLKFGDLTHRMKLFQFYCKKMDQGMQKAGRRIQQAKMQRYQQQG